MINQVTQFFSSPFFTIFGGIGAIIAILGALLSLKGWLSGIIPVSLRIGKALWKRRIAILANLEGFTTLKGSISDSGLFQEKNMIHIEPNNIEKAKNETVYLVHWESFGDKYEEVFNARRDHQTPIIIYSKPGGIPNETMLKIANRPNTVVCNFRGRLINDILVSLITTSYK